MPMKLYQLSNFINGSDGILQLFNRRWVDFFKDAWLKTRREFEQVPVASRSQKLVNISVGYSMEGWVSCRGVQSLRVGCDHTAQSRLHEVCDNSDLELRTPRLRGSPRSPNVYYTEQNKIVPVSVSACTWRGFSGVKMKGGAVFIAVLCQYSILVDHESTDRNWIRDCASCSDYNLW